MSKVHGSKGVYCGGEWVDIEDCGEWVKGGCDADSRQSRARARREEKRKLDGGENDFDVVVIGAGCIGGAVARELSKYKVSVLLLERDDDVTQGATKGNSGIVHSGYDDKPGSVRSKFCWPGNQMFAELDRDLKFGYIKNGSLVCAKNASEEKILLELMERGHKNKVEKMRIVRGKELREIEPHLHPDVVSALYSPEAGTVTPYEFAIALCENACDNGVDVRVRHQVTGIEKQGDGTFKITALNWDPSLGVAANVGGSEFAGLAAVSLAGCVALSVQAVRTYDKTRNVEDIFSTAFFALVLGLVSVSLFFFMRYFSRRGVSGADVLEDAVHPTLAFKPGNLGQHEEFTARFVVNAGGLFADKIANMVGDTSFTIKPRLGDYVLLHKNQGHLAKTTIFPCPDPVLGKGVLVQQTLWGNLILGPTARDTYLPEKLNMTKEEVMSFILQKCKALVPGFDAGEVIHTFCGARAKSSRGDWIIEESNVAAGLIHAAGIDSPGLAGSPAIALEVVRLLEAAGLGKLDKDPDFDPVRRPLIEPKNNWKSRKGERLKVYKAGAKVDPEHNVICKCEKVTEAEVINAVRSSLTVDNTQAIRRRTRAGMGHCQGSADDTQPNCELRVAEIIAREKKLRVDDVGRRPWPATSLLPNRWLEDSQKDWIRGLSKS